MLHMYFAVSVLLICQTL